MTTMKEMFNEVFYGVCEENDMEWWEVFDGELFDEVKNRILSKLGWNENQLFNDDDFSDWYDNLYMDL